MKNYRRHIFLLFTSVCFLSAPVQAQKLYKRVDKDGNVTYHDELTTKPGDKSQEIKPTIASQAIVSTPVSQQGIPIIVYTAAACEACQQVLTYLAKQGIPAEEQSITDREVQERIFAIAGSLSVPSVFVGDVLLTDINEDLLVSELKKAGYSINAIGGGSKNGLDIPTQNNTNELNDEREITELEEQLEISESMGDN